MNLRDVGPRRYYAETALLWGEADSRMFLDKAGRTIEIRLRND